MQLKLLVLSISIIFVLFACQKNQEQTSQDDTNTNAHKVIVEEVIQTSAYTYLKVKEKDKDYWAAITSREIKQGETLYFDNLLEMKNFESKELKRTFETIYFIQEISNQPLYSTRGMSAISPHSKKADNEKGEISVEPVKGGISVAELFTNRNSYANKTVKIRGQVVKFNAGIMGRNWVHIQDGTGDSGNNDLTVTTDDLVKAGDVVTFEGKITLNKDFGAGYSYEVIMEQAKTVK